MLELLCNLALEAVERSTEVVEDVCGAMAIPSGVVGGVHRVLNYKVMLVHLRQLIE